MSNKIASFKKISFEQFKKDYFDLGYNWMSDADLTQLYNDIVMPIRKTKLSAGHDITMPFDVTIPAGKKKVIPTAIRCQMDDDYVMLIFPRSSFGIKKGLFISNTIPVVDADYFNAKNEGHIFVAAENRSDNDLVIKAGEPFCQAVFIPYGVADETEVTGVRIGGVGSTSEGK